MAFVQIYIFNDLKDLVLAVTERVLLDFVSFYFMHFEPLSLGVIIILCLPDENGPGKFSSGSKSLTSNIYFIFIARLNFD